MSLEVGNSWHNLWKRKKAMWLEHNEQEYASQKMRMRGRQESIQVGLSRI